MKHTECKDCKYREGNCGYHFKMDGITNFDIASLSACDKYGDCMFFERDEEDESKGDLISREALKKAIEEEICNFELPISANSIMPIIDNAPTVERPTGEWRYGEDECGQDGWFCSECGFFVPWYYQYYENDIDFIQEYKACPHCLAEMRKGKKE